MTQRIDLSGKWTLTQNRTGDTCPARVPGDTCSALLKAKRIPDPYVGMNELEVQWVNREDWTYRRTVKVPAAMLKHERVLLTFESLDTIAAVLVNGKEAGQSTNMFTRFRVDVKDLLQPGSNEIEVRFRSPEIVAEERWAELPYPVPCGGAPVMSPHRNMVRKVQCHAGWDWGCCLMVCGIYGEACLEAVGPAVIEHVYTEQKHKQNQAAVWVTVELDSIADLTDELEVRLGSSKTSHPVDLHAGRNTVSAEVVVRKPRLWWPNGHGAQPLYDLTVKVAGQTVKKRIGLRTIELVSEEDEVGRSFLFKVNGRPIFCKGANWIPVDAMPQRHTREVFDDLLTSAAAANMNMIRVWGGGQYERREFYELCDEKGLLVWQDFMFACSMYPAAEWFLDEVRAEAEYQIKRLRDHASLALWCGNNENVGALNWYKESRENRDLYLVDYDRLTEGVLGKAVDVFDPTRTFWPSSPCGGRGDYRDCWHDDTRGDMHYWTVWHGGKSFDAYYDVVPRFCSEFGYQSFPSMETVKTYARKKDLNVTSPVMEHHQRSGSGNSRIVENFTRYCRMPQGIENFVFLSQVLQGLAIKMGVEYWRSLQPTCMGTIYWQLNDNWPVCSWASLEYGGKWKIQHYLARRFYEPVLLAGYLKKDGNVEVWVTNDTHKKVVGSAEVRVIDFNGEVRQKHPLKVSAGPGGATKLMAVPAADLHGGKPNEVFLHLRLKVGSKVQENDVFFTEYKRCELPEPKVRTAVKAKGEGYAVTVQTDVPTFFLTLDAEGISGVFDDNCLTLLPGKKRTLFFQPKKPTTVARLKKALKVQHLRGTYE